MNLRGRRLRGDAVLRLAVRETRVSAHSLILPFFVRDGKGIEEEIPSLDGQIRYSPDTIEKGVTKALNAGVSSFMIFGVTDDKDLEGTAAYKKDGVVQKAVKNLKEKLGNDAYIITDVCMCGYTSHGHCGIVENGRVDNDKTLSVLAEIAKSHVFSGADMVAPSDMMDGRVRAIRDALDKSGFYNSPIMSYAVKYASSFYGPFREAAGSSPQPIANGAPGDRKTYQMDYHNRKEAKKEVLQDIDEGADIVIVKPALSYLDIIADVSATVNVPVAAYSVSGEYAMQKAAAKSGFVNEYGIMCETAVSIFRAGAGVLITYYAKELAEAIRRGDIG